MPTYPLTLNNGRVCQASSVSADGVRAWLHIPSGTAADIAVFSDPENTRRMVWDITAEKLILEGYTVPMIFTIDRRDGLTVCLEKE